MLTDHFANVCEDDAVGCPCAVRSEGTDQSLPAAEPVGIVGGHPAPAPAAAAQQPEHGEVDQEPTSRGTDPFVALGPGEAAMDRFVDDYLELLDGRLDAIRRCLDDSDIEGARVAVLSLESSSSMLGGAALTARLTELRSQLELGPTTHRNALLSLVQVAASDFRHQLEAPAPG